MKNRSSNLITNTPHDRCNRIWAGQAAGIAVTEEGFGHVYFNDICGMEWGGVDIRNGGHPVIMNNTIHSGHGDGVVIGERGCGLIFENVIRSKSCIRGCFNYRFCLNLTYFLHIHF